MVENLSINVEEILANPSSPVWKEETDSAAGCPEASRGTGDTVS